MSEEKRDRHEIIADLVEARKQLYDAQQELSAAQAKSQVLMDIHAALGVKWGDDPYAVIARLQAAQAKLVELERDGPMVDSGYEIQAGEAKERCIPMRQALEEAEQAAEIEAREADALRKKLYALTAQREYGNLSTRLLNITLYVKVINAEHGNYWECPICHLQEHDPTCIITEAATAIEQLQARMLQTNRENDELRHDIARHVRIASEYANDVAEYGTRAEQAETKLAEYKEDAERLDWIIENSTSRGGGGGFVLKVFIPIDMEHAALRSAIDAARRKEGK